MLLALPFQQAVGLMLRKRVQIDHILKTIKDGWVKLDEQLAKKEAKEVQKFKRRAERRRENKKKLSLAEAKFRQELDAQDHFIVVSLWRQVCACMRLNTSSYKVVALVCVCVCVCVFGGGIISSVLKSRCKQSFQIY